MLGTPVAEALRGAFPGSRLVWAVHSHCAAVVEGNPHLNAVVRWPRRPLWKSLPKVVSAIRHERPEVAIDLQGLLKSGLLARLSGAKVRLGPAEAREGAAAFYTHRVPRRFDELHVVDGYLELAKAAGARWETPPKPLMPYTAADASRARDLMGIRRPRIVLNPSAGQARKQWPIERFAEIGRRARAAGASVVVTGAPADRPLADALLLALGGEATDLTGKTNLNELAAVLAEADLFVGGDTGPMHIAQAAGTTVIALFGPTDPRWLGPRGPNDAVVHAPEGMDAITVDAVWAAVAPRLSGYSR